ncbi:MAG: hypothetical protein M0Z36_08945 [Thermaerobacter sp.]|nr:hypothetical protein [Thermaerobacter sp.]
MIGERELLPGSEVRAIPIVRTPDGRLQIQRGRVVGRSEDLWRIIASPKPQKPEEAA